MLHEALQKTVFAKKTFVGLRTPRCNFSYGETKQEGCSLRASLYRQVRQVGKIYNRKVCCETCSDIKHNALLVSLTCSNVAAGARGLRLKLNHCQKVHSYPTKSVCSRQALNEAGLPPAFGFVSEGLLPILMFSGCRLCLCHTGLLRWRPQGMKMPVHDLFQKTFKVSGSLFC